MVFLLHLTQNLYKNVDKKSFSFALSKNQKHIWQEASQLTLVICVIFNVYRLKTFFFVDFTSEVKQMLANSFKLREVVLVSQLTCL